MDHQDWKPVVLTKTIKVEKPKEVSSKPFISKSNQPNIKISEDGEETIKVKKVSSSMAQIVIQARAAKNIKQTDLAKQCNFDTSIIANIEKGGCIYNAEHFNKIAKILGVKIPRE